MNDTVFVIIISIIGVFTSIFLFKKNKNQEKNIKIKVNEEKQSEIVENVNDIILENKEDIQNTEQELKDIDEKYNNNPPPDINDVISILKQLRNRTGSNEK